MRNLILILTLLLVGCQATTTYVPSAARAGTDIGVTALLEKEVLTFDLANQIHTALVEIATTEDLTVLAYNKIVLQQLKKYAGSAPLVAALLVAADAEVDKILTPKHKYILNQSLNQMKIAITEWEHYKNVR